MSTVAELKSIFDEYLDIYAQRLKSYNEFVRAEHRPVESVIDNQIKLRDIADVNDRYNTILRKAVDVECRLFAAIVNLPD